MLPPPWAVWQYLIVAAEAFGAASAYATIYILYANPYWAGLAAVIYLLAGLPIAWQVNSSLRREWELVEGLWSTCEGFECYVLGGPSRLAYCIRHVNNRIEVACLNATYGIVGLFTGRTAPDSAGLTSPPRRDFTCIKTLKGTLKTMGGYKLFKGLAAIPSPTGSIIAEVTGAMRERKGQTLVEDDIRALRSILGEHLGG